MIEQWRLYLLEKTELAQKIAERETGSPYGLDPDGRLHPAMNAIRFWETEYGCEGCANMCASQIKHTCLLESDFDETGEEQSKTLGQDQGQSQGQDSND